MKSVYIYVDVKGGFPYNHITNRRSNESRNQPITRNRSKRRKRQHSNPGIPNNCVYHGKFIVDLL